MEGKTTRVRTADGARYRFDYTGMHRYLIKLPVFSSRKIFTDGSTVLKVVTTLRDACRAHHFDVYAYCFLPDQLVLVVRGKTGQSNMKEFLSMFRSTSSEALKPVLSDRLWSRKYLERVLRKSEKNRDVATEIFRLPLEARLASRPEDYPFQGSFVLSFPFK
jgi:putative transposase